MTVIRTPILQPLDLPAELAAADTGISNDPDNPLHAAFGENALVLADLVTALERSA
jgi:hypothetical protein